MPAHNSMVGGPAPGGTAPMSGYKQTQVPLTPNSSGSLVIDGTPLRVVTIIGIAVLGVIGLRKAGFKFNVIAGV
jgi:hypothetical protein